MPDQPKMLGDPHPTEERLQGDFLKDQPFASIGPDGRSTVARFTVAVINNTCDLQPNRSSVVTCAPVFEYSGFASAIEAAKGVDRAKDYLLSVRRNKIHELLYVEMSSVEGDGWVVRMDRLCTLDFSLYESALRANRRIASFTQNGFYFFLIKLTRHLARAETEDISRITST